MERWGRAVIADIADHFAFGGEGIEAFGFEDARVATLPSLKAATGLIADAYYNHPSRSLHVVATTGTNGKTSTAWWTAQALTQLGTRCGVVGTLGVGEPPRVGSAELAEIEFTGLTTPDPVVLQAGFRRMLDNGFGACAIEASSIGIVEQRLAGTTVEVALFTNFTRDHLDYHGSMEAYWAAKRALFNWPGLRAAVINVDDPQGHLALAAGALTLHAFVFPTLPGAGRQVILGRWDLTARRGLALGINPSGHLELWVGDGERVDAVAAEVPLWPAGYDPATGEAWVSQQPVANRYNSRLSLRVTPLDLRSQVQMRL
eukprot:gene42280-56166_t